MRNAYTHVSKLLHIATHEGGRTVPLSGT
jgi:hypothetical protein